MKINLNEVHLLNTNKFQNKIKSLSKEIEAGKQLEHDVNNFTLKTIDTFGKNKSELDLNVLEDLNAILLAAHSRSLTKKLEKELSVIQGLAEKIILSIDNPKDLMERLPKNLLTSILSKMPPKEIGKFALVSKEWRLQVPEAQIQSININRLPIKDALPGTTTEEALEWIINHQACRSLEYADFTGFEDFDNSHLEKLVTHCPNLTLLRIPSSNVSDDALKFLESVPNLKELDISSCYDLEPDALKHLKHVQQLTTLKMKLTEFEADALKHLKYVKDLNELDISYCKTLEKDALKHLKYVKKLRKLNISSCNTDSLQHLTNTPLLRNLNISDCRKLKKGSLEHLKNLKHLKKLDITYCFQLEEEAVKYLEYNPGLKVSVVTKKGNISWEIKNDQRDIKKI